MSTNGFVVVGDSPATSYPVQAFRWTAATGMVSIGTLPGQSVTEALGVNADGSVVVGYDGFGGCGNNVAFRWTQATGQVSLGFPPGGNYSIAYATNADGTVVAGDAALCGSGNQAVRWTAATGWVALANLPGAIASQAFGVNADGSVLTGTNRLSDGTSQAFMWTAASGTVGLGFLPGGTISGAADVSADGTVARRDRQQCEPGKFQCRGRGQRRQSLPLDSQGWHEIDPGLAQRGWSERDRMATHQCDRRFS
jgi:probable HAF family extracellular repeat protein